MSAAQALGCRVGRKAACRALNLPRASFYRHLRPNAIPPAWPKPSRALDEAERQAVMDTLHSERFRDQAPSQVYATLLDECTYLCSIRTMYRILEEAGEVRERRDQLRHPNYSKPELLATGPNEVWSWDITKLLGPVKWNYFYLYVILDIFSRYVVGWMVAHRESAELAERLIEESYRKRHSARTTDPPRRPGLFDDLEARGLPALRPGHYQNPQPAARLRRQPLLGEPVQDAEISTGVPATLRLDRGCSQLLPGDEPWKVEDRGEKPAIALKGR
jgi:transposase InsO family protein